MSTRTLNFLRPMAERPVAYQYDPPRACPSAPASTIRTHVRIRDGRGRDRPAVARCGRVRASCTPRRRSGFRRRRAAPLGLFPRGRTHPGRSHRRRTAIAFDHNIRNAARAGQGEPGIRGPVDRYAQRLHRAFRALSARGASSRRGGWTPMRCSNGASRSSICGVRSGGRSPSRRSPCATRAASRPAT